MELHKKLKDKNVVVMSVCIDDQANHKKVMDFLKSKQATLTNYWVEQGKELKHLYAMGNDWGFNAFPAMFVLDQKGDKSPAKSLEEAESKIEKLLKAT